MKRYTRATFFAFLSIIPVAFFTVIVLGVATIALQDSVVNDRWLEPELIRHDAYGVRLSGYDVVLLVVVCVAAATVFIKNVRSNNQNIA